MTISAKIICDSISPDKIRITTLQLRYPRFIHSEFMTHRLFSRNASSSRAVPVEKLIEDVKQDTAMPIFWGKNQPGMQAKEECKNDVQHKVTYYIDGKSSEKIYPVHRIVAWEIARDNAIRLAQEFHAAGYHKQIVNRLLEPFSHINVVVTATEWSNFFKLRDHEDAQPEIRELAVQMKNVMRYSHMEQLDYGQWHLPYITMEDKVEILRDSNPQDKWVNTAICCSVARCARVSYVTHDMKKPDIEADLKL
jgi:hypothetical protein